MRIAQFSTYDQAGGAERIAFTLHRSFKDAGHAARLYVKRKLGSDPDVVELASLRAAGAYEATLLRVAVMARRRSGRIKGAGRVSQLIEFASVPSRLRNYLRGRDIFDYAETHEIPSKVPADVVHCHNLHGDYFDLRELPRISSTLPVFMTLHDEWSYTGHCAYTLGCDRWQTGCGACPHLGTPPAILRDGTRENFAQKRDIYRDSRLCVATPSRWLNERARRSMLAPAVAESRVIPYGVDHTIFNPMDKQAARRALGLPVEHPILLFVAQSVRHAVWKDFATLREAVHRVARLNEARRVLFIAVGSGQPPEHIGASEIRFVPYEKDPVVLANYYAAADAYLHAAIQDNFPVVILEALSCGTPVIATAVGGISEQVDEGLTGFLVPRQDAAAMAAKIGTMLDDAELRARMAHAAAATAKHRFSHRRMARDYLEWFADVRSRSGTHA